MSSDRSAIGVVQASVYQYLHADTTLMALAPVFDQVPQGQPYPYLEITDLVETLDDTIGEQGRSITVTISAWDQTPGYKLLEQILDNLIRLLDEGLIPTVSGSGWTIWNNIYVRGEVSKLPDGITRQVMTETQIMVTKDDLSE
jgi:hypothetical protein